MTLPACLTIRCQVSSQDALKRTPEHALKYTPNCIRWHIPSLLGTMLPSTLSRGKTFPPHLTICSQVCSCMLNPESCRVSGARLQEAWGWWCMAGSFWRTACGMWHVACGGLCMVAEIMTSVDIKVWTLSLLRPPRQDLTMPYSHGVDNRGPRFCRKGRKFDLGESRSPTQMVQ